MGNLTIHVEAREPVAILVDGVVAGVVQVNRIAGNRVQLVFNFDRDVQIKRWPLISEEYREQMLGEMPKLTLKQKE